MAHPLFLLCSVLAVAGALGVIFSRNAVNAAMGLLICLVGVAALFLRLEAAFLAFLLLLVYAGAVVALFLFIVMLLDVRGRAGPLPRGGALAGALVGLAALLAGLVGFVRHAAASAPPLPAAIVGDSLKPYAYALFTTYLLPVQVIGFLLLSAMLGTIALSRRSPAATPRPTP